MPEDATAPPGRGCAPMVRAACDAGREGLGAATPITRDQWCAQDPEQSRPARVRTGLQPDAVVGGRVGGLDVGAGRGEQAVCGARGLTGVTSKKSTMLPSGPTPGRRESSG